MASHTHGCFTKKIHVNYKNKDYYVLTITTKKGDDTFEMPIVIDKEDYHRVRKITWFRTNKYINSSKMIKRQTTYTYLHQFIMNHTFDGTNYGDHINRIPQDNRKANLRLVTQTEQNWNQKKKTRTTVLPADCGFDKNDIPTNVEYHPPNGTHAASFEVVIKIDGKRVFRKKTTQSKKVDLCKKLDEAKEILNKLMDTNPEWFENRCLNGKLSEEGQRLHDSYFEILQLAKIEDPFNE